MELATRQISVLFSALVTIAFARDTASSPVPAIAAVRPKNASASSGEFSAALFSRGSQFGNLLEIREKKMNAL
jgi:hypothetical protein